MAAHRLARNAVSLAGPLALTVAGLFGLPLRSASAAPSKDECIDAHSRGQDARDKGQLSQARQSFVACGQSSCPGLIQADCVRFGEELEKLVPTVSFAARDTRQGDLPDTSVYVDNALFATRLEEGKPHEIDPGRHVVRFVHGDQEMTLAVIVSQGEKGRVIVATFTDHGAPLGRSNRESTTGDQASQSSRSAAPLVVAGLGGAALVGGAVLALVGFKKIPSTCSYASKDCVAPPGDRSFDDAKSGASLVNAGLVVGGAGVAVLTGGLLWYFLSPSTPTRVGAIAPWATPHGSGVALTGLF